MEKMRIIDQAADEFLQAAQLFISQLLALNLERSNEEIIQTYRGFSGDIATMSESVLDSLREDENFIKNSEEILKGIKELTTEEYNEDSEAAGV